jgi:thymidylate synthase
MHANLTMFDDVDKVLAWVTDRCLEFGTPIAPRQEPTYELIGISFGLENPRARIPSFSARKWSLPLALGELCWHLRGATDLDSLTYYAPRWRNYSDDGFTIDGSCYGKTVFGTGAASQWEYAKQLLIADPPTRRAILIFDQPRESDDVTADKACLTSMQFLVRENRLHAVVTMRSNDIYLGVPYDVFNFTMFQEIMALELGVPLGTYVHFVGSMHLYERDIQRASRSYLQSKSGPIQMGAIPSLESLAEFVNFELSVRCDRPAKLEELHPFWRPYASVLKDFRRNKSLMPAH